MILDFDSVRSLFQYLSNTLSRDDSDIRVKAYAPHNNYKIAIATKLISSIKTEQAKLGIIKYSRAYVATIEGDKAALLENINQVANYISDYESLLHIGIYLAKQGTNGCHEHAIILSLSLLKLFGAESGHCFEMVYLTERGTGRNHCFIVMNRASNSILEDVSSWGEKCMVLDSYGSWYSPISALPSDTAIRNLKDYKVHAGVDIYKTFRLDMELNSLTKFSNQPNHPLYSVETTTRQYLLGYINRMISSMAAKLPQMPTLRSLPSANSFEVFQENKSRVLAENNVVSCVPGNSPG